MFEQHGELVATQAGERIAPTHLALEQRTKLPQQGIACVVAAGVVDDPELVEIEVQQGVAALPGSRGLQGPVEPLLEFAAVRQPGQHIVAGVIGEPTLQFPCFGDIVEYEHATDHLAGAAASRCRRTAHIQFVAIAPYQQDRAQGLDRLLLTNGSEQRVFQCLAGFLVEGAEHLADVAAQHFGQLPAGQCLGHRVQIFHLPMTVGGNDAIADTVQGDLGVLFLAEQGLFVALAFGDVELDRHESTQGAACIQLGTQPALHPPPFAILVTQAVQTAHRPRTPGDMVTNLLRQQRQIFRVHQLPPTGPARIQLLRPISQHRLPARAEVRLLRQRVVFPHAIIGTAVHQRIAFPQHGMIARQRHAIQAGAQADPHQLEQQMERHVPPFHRHGGPEADESGRLATHGKPDHQHGTQATLAEHQCLASQVVARLQRVANLEQTAMPQPFANPRQALQRGARQTFRRRASEMGFRRDHALHASGGSVIEGDERGIGTRRFPQDFNVLLQHGFSRGGLERLEVDGDLGAGDVDAERRKTGPAVPQLRGQEIGSSEIAALREAGGTPEESSLRCRIAIDHAQRIPLGRPRLAATWNALCHLRLGNQYR